MRRWRAPQRHEINELVQVRPLPLTAAMTTSRSIESTTRKFMWAALIILAATAAACGGSTQGLAGTAPSQVSAVAAASDSGASLSLLKEGKGKGRPSPDIGTTPTTDADAPETDGDESGHGHGHGKAAIQYEGFSQSISGGCGGEGLGLTIVFDVDTTVTTVKRDDLTTEFQRATCEELLAAGATTPVHLHVAAQWEGETLVAIYVRMQGPKGDDGAPEEQEGTTPTTTTN